MAYTVTEIVSEIYDYKIVIDSRTLVDRLNRAKNEHPNLIIAGLVFIPITEPVRPHFPQSNIYFSTYGLRVAVVLWDGVAVQSIRFWGDTDLTEHPRSQVVEENTCLITDPNRNIGGALRGLPWRIGDTRNNEWTLVDVTQATGNNINGSAASFFAAREFDLVFLDIDQCKYLGGVHEQHFLNEMGQQDFNYVVSSESPLYPSGTYIDPEQRGIQLSRAFFDMDVDVPDPSPAPGIASDGSTVYTFRPESDLTRYRTLKFTPWPIPPLQDYMGRTSVAYHIGAACPPLWIPLINLASINFMAQLIKKATEYELVPVTPPSPPYWKKIGFWKKLKFAMSGFKGFKNEPKK